MFNYWSKFNFFYSLLVIGFTLGAFVASPTILYKAASGLLLILIVFAYKYRETKISYAIVGCMLLVHHSLLVAMQHYQSISVDTMTPFIINAGLLYAPLLPNPVTAVAAVATLTVHFFTYKAEDDFGLIIIKVLGTLFLGLLSGKGLQFLQKLKIERDRFYKASITDPLTGLYTFTHIIQVGQELINTGHKLRAVVIDLDDYKNINDTYGHFVGNEVLIQFAAVLGRIFGSESLIGRLNGDKFIVLLEQGDEKSITGFLDQVKDSCYISDPELVPIHLDFSYGIALPKADECITIEELLNRVDKNMYNNKIAVRSRQTSCDIDKDIPEQFLDLLTVLSQKDMYTFVHSFYVARFARKLAKVLELSCENINHIWLAGWLHDIGKIVIPNQILRKPASLTEDEYQSIKKHVGYSLDILQSFNLNEHVLRAIGEHHERYDGTGYPQGKSKEEISIEGRILAITDAYSAMTIKRVYRNHQLSVCMALQELHAGKGLQFDPVLVEAFIRLVEARGAA